MSGATPSHIGGNPRQGAVPDIPPGAELSRAKPQVGVLAHAHSTALVLAERHSNGFIIAPRGHAGPDLIAVNPPAFILLYVIAMRAQRTDRPNPYGLRPGQALIGDYRNYGMTERAYRTAKRRLERVGYATFRATNRGTIATLIDRSIFDINAEGADGPNDRQATDKRRADDGQATTTNNEISIKNEITKKGESSGWPCEGFPASEEEALKAVKFAQCSPEFAAQVWNEAVACGGKDLKGRAIVSWRHHLKARTAGKRSWEAEHPRPRQQSKPVKPNPNRTF